MVFTEKNFITLLYSIVLGMVAVPSCTDREALLPESGPADSRTLQKVRVTAVTGGAPTKAYLSSSDICNYWSSGDELSLYVNSGTPYKVTLVDGENSTTGTFEGEIPIVLPADVIYAVYPSSAAMNAMATDPDMVSITIPDEQTVVWNATTGDSYDPSACVMAATVSGAETESIYFNNCCALVRLDLPAGNYESVTFSAVGGEGLAGTAVVTFSGSTASVAQTSSAEQILKVSVPTGETSSTHRVYAAVIPQELSWGLRVAVKYAGTNGSTYRKTYNYASGGMVLARSHIIPLGQWSKDIAKEDNTELPKENWWLPSFGGYYSWGETTGFGEVASPYPTNDSEKGDWSGDKSSGYPVGSKKTKYDKSTYKWGSGQSKKYRTNNVSLSDPTYAGVAYIDDAARQNWGGKWRMMSITEGKALLGSSFVWKRVENYTEACEYSGAVMKDGYPGVPFTLGGKTVYVAQMNLGAEDATYEYTRDDSSLPRTPEYKFTGVPGWIVAESGQLPSDLFETSTQDNSRSEVKSDKVSALATIKHVFLPAAGQYHVSSSSTVDDLGEDTWYWLGDLDGKSTAGEFNSGGTTKPKYGKEDRYHGCSIRPVWSE